MRTDLLLELADFLEKLDPNRFDIRTWRRPSKDSVGFVSDEQRGGSGNLNNSYKWYFAPQMML